MHSQIHDSQALRVATVMALSFAIFASSLAGAAEKCSIFGSDASQINSVLGNLGGDRAQVSGTRLTNALPGDQGRRSWQQIVIQLVDAPTLDVDVVVVARSIGLKESILNKPSTYRVLSFHRDHDLQPDQKQQIIGNSIDLETTVEVEQAYTILNELFSGAPKGSDIHASDWSDEDWTRFVEAAQKLFAQIEAQTAEP